MSIAGKIVRVRKAIIPVGQPLTMAIPAFCRFAAVDMVDMVDGVDSVVQAHSRPSPLS